MLVDHDENKNVSRLRSQVYAYAREEFCRFVRYSFVLETIYICLVYGIHFIHTL